MVSITSLKQKVFGDTGKCLFRCWTNKLWCSTRIYFRATPLPNIYINDLSQALNETGSYLYADNTCIFYQDKDVEKWFIDNKLSILFGGYKTKQFFFSQMKSPPKINISYGDYSLKQNILDVSDATLILISRVSEWLVEFLKRLTLS